MAKGKRKSTASAGPRRTHGPKKKLHHCWSSTIRKQFADCGLLSKYYDYESFNNACSAKGKRNISKSDFNAYVVMTREEKDKYFANIKK